METHHPLDSCGFLSLCKQKLRTPHCSIVRITEGEGTPRIYAKMFRRFYTFLPMFLCKWMVCVRNQQLNVNIAYLMCSALVQPLGSSSWYWTLDFKLFNKRVRYSLFIVHLPDRSEPVITTSSSFFVSPRVASSKKHSSHRLHK